MSLPSGGSPRSTNITRRSPARGRPTMSTSIQAPSCPRITGMRSDVIRRWSATWRPQSSGESADNPALRFQFPQRLREDAVPGGQVVKSTNCFQLLRADVVDQIFRQILPGQRRRPAARNGMAHNNLVDVLQAEPLGRLQSLWQIAQIG